MNVLWPDQVQMNSRGYPVSMRLGVLDVGSNAAQLHVVDASAGAPPLPIHAIKVPTRLSDEVGVDEAISQKGVDRVVAAVQRALDAARDLTVDQLYPFVTAAIRDANNRGAILEQMRAEDRYPVAVPAR